MLSCASLAFRMARGCAPLFRIAETGDRYVTGILSAERLQMPRSPNISVAEMSDLMIINTARVDR